MQYFSVKSREASQLRRRKYALIRRFGLLENALGGHLAETYRRCGKPTCHCAEGTGHPMWTLSYSADGKKHVEVLPEALADELTPLVEQGRQWREATAEVLAINLRLLHLWRAAQRQAVRSPSQRQRPSKHR